MVTVIEVRVLLGGVIEVEASDRYNPDDGPLRIRVFGVRIVTNSPMRNDWVWLEGTGLDEQVDTGARISALVKASIFSPERDAAS